MEQLPTGPGPGGNGEGPGTRTCSASSSSRLRAPAASTCLEACLRVACVWLESRLAWRCSRFPSLSRALASCGRVTVQGAEGEQRPSSRDEAFCGNHANRCDRASESWGDTQLLEFGPNKNKTKQNKKQPRGLGSKAERT